ncbi:MAG: S8 family serine peptidase [Deltaproteobacteria bacterium]|nr:S8 family serine peptidase [Deltaproteobacteria bacterium]
MHRLLPLVLLASFALPASAAPDRFQTRTYRTGKLTVAVDARGDAFAVNLPGLQPQQVAVVVEGLLEKVPGVQTSLVRAWSLQSHGLVGVEVAAPLSREQLTVLASLVTDAGGHLWPALTRPTGTESYNRAFSDDRLVLTAAPGQLDVVLKAVIAKSEGKLVRQSKRLKDTALLSVGAAFDFDAVNASLSLAAMPGVVSAEPDLYRELTTKATVDDPLFPLQWHLARGAGNADVPGEGTVHADTAWDLSKGSPDVVVAVFDSGTEWLHPDLLPNVRQDLMFDPSNGLDGNGDPVDRDPSPECQGSQDGIDFSPLCTNQNEPFRESHGTSVSGTIAARGDNGIGLTGVCPGCSLMPVRLLGDQGAQGGMSIAESFAVACDPTNDGTGAGAWIINNSWGPGFSAFFPLSENERTAFGICRNVGRAGKGTVIIFAAGNETSNVAADAYAKDPYVIGVAASTNLDDWAAYSNFGAEIDVAAPSLGGTVNEDNFGIVTTDVRGPEGYSIQDGDENDDDDDYTTSFSGTSASCPVTSGVAGLILSVNPNLSAEQVRLVLTSTADKIRADKVNWFQIFGQDINEIFNYDDNGHSIGFGYGRINAAAATALVNDPVLLAAALGDAGARCDDVPCAICSPENVCLSACTEQAGCADGSVCNLELGACELPREGRTDFLAPCNADCTYCVPQLDTEFELVDGGVCSHECTTDASCDPRCADGDPECTTDNFDCRPITDDPDGVAICAIGSPNSGGPADFGQCGFNQFVGVPTLVLSDDGKELCGENCFDDAPGSCPFGFACGEAVCECTRVNGNGDCRELTCDDANGGPADILLCLPKPGHADECKSDVNCQFGDYCQLPALPGGGEGPEGVCHLDDRDCDICASCNDSSECSGRGACLGATNEDAGVCAVACDDGEPCPGNTVCRTVSVPSFGGRLRSFEACLGDGPDNGDDPNTTPPQQACQSFACEVGCRADIPCGAGLVCTEGACVEAPPPPDDVDDSALRLSGGGPSCQGCSSTNGVFGVLPLALLGLLRRRRQR